MTEEQRRDATQIRDLATEGNPLGVLSPGQPRRGGYTRTMGRLTGERRALAAAVLAFYAFLYLIVALAPPPGWAACFAAMTLVYAGGFFALVAGYFWARWYAIGLGMSGLVTAAFSMIQIGLEPVLVFYGATHAFVSLVLWGNGMATVFDGKKEWRERFHLDENATHKLGKSVIRLGMSLPYIVLYALAPKEPGGGALLAGLAGVILLTGVVGMLKLRGWSVLALAGGAVALGAELIASPPQLASIGYGYAINVAAAGGAALLLVLAAMAPLARPILRGLRARETA